MVSGAGDDAIIALLVLRICLPDWMPDDELIKPPSFTRFASTLSLATSMGRSYATVHRLVTNLIDEGLLVRTGKGVAFSRDGDSVARAITFLEDSHDLLLRFAANLDEAGALKSILKTNTPRGTHLSRAITETALDIMLMPYEVFRDQIGNWTAKKLWLALTTMTTRHITEDRDLNRLYAVRSTPNEDRRAVSRHTLAKLTFIPPSSAWRHLKAMESKGVISRRGDGWTLLTEHLLDNEMELAVQAGAAFYMRHLEELIGNGLIPGHERYAIQKPALIQP